MRSVAAFQDTTIRPTTAGTRALPTAVALLMAAHVEITQHVSEDGSISRVVSWPETSFNLERDGTTGQWSVFDASGAQVGFGLTSEDALRSVLYNLD